MLGALAALLPLEPDLEVVGQARDGREALDLARSLMPDVVLRLAADGWSAQRIAGELHLSHGTVRNYLSEAKGKLGADNRIDAARIARERGWL